MVAKIANVTRDEQKANAYLSNSTSINTYAAFTSDMSITLHDVGGNQYQSIATLVQ